MSVMEKIDARNLWVPATIALAFGASLFSAGVIYKGISDRAESTITLQADIKDMNRQLNELRGSINTLVSMQGQVAQVSADVSGLRSRMDSQETRLQTMDAWIQNTREKLREQGFRSEPYSSRP